MFQKLMYRFIAFQIKYLLKGFHLHENRKKKEIPGWKEWKGPKGAPVDVKKLNEEAARNATIDNEKEAVRGL
jgi:hypothetical protein